MQEFVNALFLFRDRLVVQNFLIKDGKIFFDYVPTLHPIDLTGKVVTPGFVDVHVHTRTPGYTHKENIHTITQSALAGGFTTLLAMANVRPEPTTVATFENVLQAVKKSPLNILQCAKVTTEEGTLVDFDSLSKLTKFFSDDGEPVVDLQTMKSALQMAKKFGATLFLHEQDKNQVGIAYDSLVARSHQWPTFDASYEWKMIQRDLELNQEIKAHVHIQHVSSAASLQYLAQKTSHVTAELTPHHLFFNATNIKDHGHFRMNPPLNSPADQQALIQAFKGGLIDVIATDHAPHTPSEKDVPYAQALNGVIGLETAFPAAHTVLQKNAVPLEQILRAFTYNPAKILGVDVEPHPGQKVNITIIDPHATWTIGPEHLRSKSANCPFIGQTVRGKVLAVFYNNIHHVNK